jgi:Ca2+-binding RTX toxin-like protein
MMLLLAITSISGPTYVPGFGFSTITVLADQTGGAGDDTLYGTDQADTLDGSGGNDALYGRGGNDFLIGGAASPGGTNQLWGGSGNDTAAYWTTTGTVYADLGAQAGYVDGVLTDQMNSIENLWGGSGSDTLVGDGGANVLTGGAGTDYLYGQGGDDTLIGGSAAPGGTNQLWGGSGNDTASYAGTMGTVYADLGAQAGYVDGVLTDQMNSIENLTGGGWGTTWLVGDGGTNVLTGGAGTDFLYGQGGDDILIGGAVASGGPNQLWGGTGNDTASYAGTTGTVYADLGAQAGYVDGVLTDLMNSIENLAGGSGTNTLVGDGGANVLTGGAGTDYLYGGNGDDILIGGAAPSPAGPNQLWGGSGSDSASYAGTTGNVSADLRQQRGFVDGQLVDQMNSIENLVGGSGNDSLTGDAASNVLTGGVGADVLDGGGGGDRFVYQSYADSNMVTGVDAVIFVSGSDKLDFTALHTDASHVVITSTAGQTSLFVEQTSGTFNAATDLVVTFGPALVTTGDILF